MKKGSGKICGVGVNDSVGPISQGYIYKTWRRMLDRCYGSTASTHKPTYAGCTVVEEWHRYSCFEKWMQGQDWKGKELDKDILVQGNKVYGPDTCVFVSLSLSRFLNDRRNSRGKWPIGVSWHKRDKRLQAQCNNPFSGKVECLGRFDCEIEAHEAWRKRKHELACMYADIQADSRVANALRLRFAEAMK